MCQCSRDCGFGYKTREVNCVNTKLQEVDVGLCNATRRPKDRRRCSEFPCPFMWNTSPWSEVRMLGNQVIYKGVLGLFFAKLDSILVFLVKATIKYK